MNGVADDFWMSQPITDSSFRPGPRKGDRLLQRTRGSKGLGPRLPQMKSTVMEGFFSLLKIMVIVFTLSKEGNP